jgi:RHS repeat-associated protein
VSGRMSEARRNGVAVARYGYDADGRRIQRQVLGTGGFTRHYLHLLDGQALAEATDAGVTTREYIWLDDLLIAAVDVSGTDATLYHVHAGPRGEPLRMTNAARALVWDAAYEPFGAASVFSSTTPLDIRLPGQMLHGETGLHQNWHRDHDPSTGRYAQPDPIGLDGGPSVYQYVGGDPMNFIDPEGLQAAEEARNTAPVCCAAEVDVRAPPAAPPDR